MTPNAGQRLGLFYSLAAMLLFCMSDAVVKHGMTSLTVFQLMALGNLGAVILCGAYALYQKVDLLHVRSKRIVAIYGGLYLAEMATFFTALSMMDFSLVFIFVMTIPIAAAKLANLWLGEPLSLCRHVALLLAFSGVVLTVMLQHDGLNLLQVTFWGVVFALLDIAFCAVKMVFLKKHGGEENPQALNFWALAIMMAGGMVLALVEAKPFAPGPDVVWLLLYPFGVFLGGLFYVLSYRHAPATVIAPVMYVQLPAAMVIGTLFFGEELTLPFWAGTVLMALAGLMFYGPERKAAVA